MASQPSDIGKKVEGKEDVPPVDAGASAPPDDVEDFPDPDEDDLDDLDDFLPEFSTQKKEAKKPETPAVGPSTAPAPAPDATSAAAPKPSVQDATLGDDMAELEKGMASFFSELESSPEMKAQFEDLFKSIAEAATEEAGIPSDPSEQAKPASSSANANTPSAAAGPSKNFQEKIQETMERMKNSGERTTEELNQEGTKDFMQDLIGMLGKTDMSGEGGEEDFNKMLMGMMEQLTNKDILYEPMKELHEQFPGWLEKNKDKTTEEDLARYDQQRVVVAEIVAKFEEGSYSDDNAADREYIVERMQKMQDAGSPPPDLVGDLQSAQDVLNQDVPNMNMEGCNPQ